MQVSSAEKTIDAAVNVVRLGQINFVNCLPVVVPVLTGAVKINALTTYLTPSELNQAYSDGKLDGGAMSSHYYLKAVSRELLTLIPNLSISSMGEVGSVLFFSKLPIDKLRECPIVVSESSLTSVNLLKIMLAEEYGFSASAIKIVPQSCPSFDNQDFDAKAVLAIGDRALKMDPIWSKDCIRIDLGRWWNDRYQLPMVYGVWGAKANWVKVNQFRFDEIAMALQESIKLGLTGLFPAVVEEAQRRTQLDRGRLEHYFRKEINYELTEKHLQGLEVYKQLCLEHDLI